MYTWVVGSCKRSVWK